MFEWVLQHAWLIALIPFLAFAFIGLFLYRWPKVSAGISLFSIGIGLIMSLILLKGMANLGVSPDYEAAVSWLRMPGLTIEMGILVDGLSIVMLFIVTFIAFLVQLYSLGYMKGDPGFASYYAYQSIFAAAMLGLVLANNFGQMYVFWELVGLASYLLIGFWFGKDSARDAAKKAFITNRVGDFGFLLGILFVQIIFGTLNFGELTGEVASYTNTGGLLIVTLLLLAGPVGKSAQFPLHVWLPDAMEGPTPVSALIHAATMVAAGVYLIARAFFIFSSTSEAMQVIAFIGGFTALFAAVIALTQYDIKRILAYSTLSQLGYMVMAMGIGAMTAGMFHLTTHAFFKALLFLGAGSVIYALHHEQDIRKMGGLVHKMPITTWTFVIGALALAGIPPLAGFWSKDEILLSAYAGGYTGLYILGSLVAFFTAFYMFRLIFTAFFGEKTENHLHDGHERHEVHESPWVMTMPLLILAFMSIFAGFIGAPVTGNIFGHYIHYHGEVHHEPEIMVVVLSTILALAGIFLAWLFYGKKVLSQESLKQRLGWIYNVVFNKFYIDEIYAWLIRTFVDGSARIMFWIDIHIINRLVDLSAELTGGAGSKLRYTENGQVQTYAYYMIGGIIIISAAVLLAGLGIMQ
ncbi:NADH-quinone oxidoreductase subunit L [Thermosyntropha sp.]|uniref:NADH-quinone oxidoreductase subunit L n=1 Tax=Thermosyntropha sp. TaxID=2740820 RepID=UPI0025FF3E1D|nr:NADH-quinone oxidoreductase subunit L [Thermosyntropha sp.]MBO8159480.1 NADH-quinone oxidoreductase subunit L [Thermosyntropha sp.]